MQTNPKWSIVLLGASEPIEKNAIGQSSLGEQLTKINQLREMGMPEAIVFYAARIVEDLVRQALIKYNLQHGDALDVNLNLLYQWGKIDEGSLAVGHMLRRLGNEVRHLERGILVGEEPTIVGLLQIWLEWFVNHFSTHSEGSKGPQVFFPDWSVNVPLLRILTRGNSDEITSKLSSEDAVEVLKSDAAIANFAGERLIDCRSPIADSFTRKVLERFPRSLRTSQIRALYFSRNNNPSQAVYILRPLTKRSRVDSETIGILGGAYKNLWIQTQDADYLKKSHEQYSVGANNFPNDYYLLINVAATALWLGDKHLARGQAYEVVQILSKYGLAGDKQTQIIPSYWAIATLAEAHFLGEQYPKAASLYRQIRLTDTTGGRWARTAEQLRLHIEKLGDPKIQEMFEEIVVS